MIANSWRDIREDTILQLLAEGVGPAYVALGRKPTRKAVIEALISLANNDGGILLLGSKQDGRRLVGLTNVEATRNLLLEMALAATPPLRLPDPLALVIDGKTVLAQVVPPGLPHVYSFSGLYLIRQGEKNVPLTAYQLQQLLTERDGHGFESKIVPDATLQDISDEAAKAYFNHLSRPVGESLEAFLATRGCLRQDNDERRRPTFAGILLFGRDPQRFLRSATITAVHYSGTEMKDEFVRSDIGGTLPEQVEAAEAFIRSQMPARMRIVGLHREEAPLYPFVVVREAIVNAVAHRDYAVRGEGIRVLLFSDRLEVYSPGRLPGHVTLQNLRDERFSRNESIVQVLADLGFIERLGYGINRMLQAMEEAGLPPPEFQESVAGFRVTLRSKAVATAATRRWDELSLNLRQQLALAYLQEHLRITNREYRTLVPDVSDETVRRDLAEMVEKGLLLKIGDRRATYYVLKR